MSFLLIAISIAQVDSVGVTVDIHARYRAIVEQHKRELWLAGNDSKKRNSVIETTNEKLTVLLNMAPDVAQKGLKDRDYVALCGAANRLGRTDDALHFAEEAVARAEGIEAYLALVHCLCRMGRMDAAEGAVRQAAARFPESETLYLLPNVLALKFKSLEASERAHSYMVQTIAMVLKQLEKSPFYLAHLALCLNELDHLAGRCNRRSQTREQLNQWTDGTREILNCRLESIRSNGDGLVPAEKDFYTIRVLNEAIVALNDGSDTQQAEAALCNWIAIVLKCENVFEIYPTWLAEVSHLVDAVQRALAPEFIGDDIQLRLAGLGAALEKHSAANMNDVEIAELLRKKVKRTVALVAQHQRHLALVGRSLFSGMQLAQSDKRDTSYTLVHVFDPFAKELLPGLESVRGLDVDRRWTRGSEIKVRYIAVQTGAKWDVERRRLVRLSHQTVEEEEGALEALKRILRTEEAIEVLPSSSDDSRKLQAESFPINVLLDSRGRVLCILTGPEREKVIRMVRLAKNSAFEAPD